MTSFITAITGQDGITIASMWGYLTELAPLLITFFAVAVGYRVLRRALNKGSKFKAGI